MPLTLHLGVSDVPYVQPANATRGSSKTHAGKIRYATTGDIAEKLERDYGVMEHFFEWHGGEIAADLEEGLKGALESYALGAPVQLEPFGSGIAKVEERFRDFLSTKEMDSRIAGVPTQAAQRGVSHRFKRPYAKHPPRPSFVDTGLYEASMKAWID